MSRDHANVLTVLSWFESSWNPDSVGDTTLSEYGSIGLWQIFTGVHTPEELGVGTGAWTPALIGALKVPTVNAHAAKVVLDEQGYTAWSTYNEHVGSAQYDALLKAVTDLTGVPAAAPAPTPIPTPTPQPAPAPKPGLTAKDADYLDSLGNHATGAAEAVVRANNTSDDTVGMCLRTVRTWWGIPAKALTAIAAWRAVPVKERHSFYTPPAGVPVFWAGGTTGQGHVALSVGGGKVRTSDFPIDGKVATLDIAEIHLLDSRLTYLGWTETLNGYETWKA